MKLLVQQLLLAKDEVTNNKPCSGSFETIHGIPCYHTLREIKRLKTKVTKAKFHKHWHFERPVSSVEDGEAMELVPPSSPEPVTTSPRIFAPRKVVTRGRIIGVKIALQGGILHSLRLLLALSRHPPHHLDFCL